VNQLRRFSLGAQLFQAQTLPIGEFGNAVAPDAQLYQV
jgi:hypothetical protein